MFSRYAQTCPKVRYRGQLGLLPINALLGSNSQAGFVANECKIAKALIDNADWSSKVVQSSPMSRTVHAAWVVGSGKQEGEDAGMRAVESVSAGWPFFGMCPALLAESIFNERFGLLA